MRTCLGSAASLRQAIWSHARAITITEWDTKEQAQGQLTALDFGQETADVGIEIGAIYVYEVVALAEGVPNGARGTNRGRSRLSTPSN